MATLTYVATRTALKAINTTVETAVYLTEAGREGLFVWELGNYSSVISTDVNEGIYIKANAVPSSTGAWVRAEFNSTKYARTIWFGDGWDGLAKALAVTGNVILTPGAAYTLVSTISLGDRNIDIVGPHSTLYTRSGSSAFFRIRNTCHDIQTVSSIQDPNTTPTIIVSDASKFPKGTIIKIGSDEPLPESPSNTYRGEFATIKDSDTTTNVLTLGSPLYYTYSLNNNCRIGRLPKQHSLRIDIGILSMSPDEPEFDNQFFIEGYASAKLRIGRVPYVSGTVVNLRSCFSCDTEIAYLGDGNTGENANGIVLSASEYCQSKIFFSGAIRHAIDSGGVDGPTGASMWEYGASAYNCGRDSQSEGGRQTPYASHHGTRSMIYRDCRARGGSNGTVAFRGTGNQAIDCHSIDQPGGFAAFRQSGTEHSNAITDNTVFENCRVIRGWGTMIGATGEVTVAGGIFDQQYGDAGTRLVEVQDGGSIRFTGDQCSL